MTVTEDAAGRNGGWWRILKTTLAVAHSGGILFFSILLVQLLEAAARPGPSDVMSGVGLVAGIIFLGFLVFGLPWSVFVFAVIGDPGPLGAWAMVHKGLSWTLMIVPAVLNSYLLWLWALRRERHSQLQFSDIAMVPVAKRIALVLCAAFLLTLVMAFPHVPPYGIIGWTRVAVAALALVIFYRGVHPKRQEVIDAAE